MHALLQAVGLHVIGGFVTIGGHPRVQDVVQTVLSHLFEGVVDVTGGFVAGGSVAGGSVNCGSVLGETVVDNEMCYTKPNCSCFIDRTIHTIKLFEL